MTIGVLNFLVKIFSNEKTLLFHSFVKVNMKKLTLLIALGFTSMVFGQNPSLPKAIGKNWVLIPALDFRLDGVDGNDSVNFVKACHKVKTDAFFVFNKEITNQEYREFVNAVKNPSMLPDTNSWNTDFEMAYNDPMRQYYFWHPTYKDYPVVGISQSQAAAYCKWFQTKVNEQLSQSKNNDYTCFVTLPTEMQWESVYYYSYLKDEKYTHFAWLLENKLLKTKDKYNLNFGIDFTKEGVGIHDYMKDGGMYPVVGNKYKPTKHGIYNLLGNVAEWTISPAYNFTDSSKVFFNKETKQVITYLKCNGTENYDTARSYEFYNNPYNLKPVYEKDGYIAAKGGSWCHSTFYLQPEVSLFCKPNEQHSYIGFRPVMTLVKK